MLPPSVPLSGLQGDGPHLDANPASGARPRRPKRPSIASGFPFTTLQDDRAGHREGCLHDDPNIR
jgi:hypothetical protein